MNLDLEKEFQLDWILKLSTKNSIIDLTDVGHSALLMMVICLPNFIFLQNFIFFLQNFNFLQNFIFPQNFNFAVFRTFFSNIFYKISNFWTFLPGNRLTAVEPGKPKLFNRNHTEIFRSNQKKTSGFFCPSLIVIFDDFLQFLFFQNFYNFCNF